MITLSGKMRATARIALITAVASWVALCWLMRGGY